MGDDERWENLLGLRPDGRKPEEPRFVAAELGRSRCEFADGSCELRQGLTTVLATCAGPKEAARRSDERHDRCVLVVTAMICPFAAIGERSKGVNERAGRDLAACVKRALEGAVLAERYPRTVVEVSLLVTVDDGGLVACSVNAAALALVDAGVFLRDIVACASLACRPGRAPLVDPTRNEERRAARLDVAVLPASGALLYADLGGAHPVPFGDLDDALERASSAAARAGAQLAAFARDHVAAADEVREESMRLSREAEGIRE